ncbi:MAG: thiaminase II [Chloroflexi bacterium]|nr:thiaminase II [Chloroflexota bacterium]
MTRFSDQLRDACADDWGKAHEEHPFVVAMGEASLSLERFQYFMRQDYLFLIDYARVLAIAASKSPDLSSMGHWASLLDETLNSEMELHRGFCADFGITVAELEATEPMPATVAYTDHLTRTAYAGEIHELAAALLPCQWGYDEVGQRLAPVIQSASGTFHARWVAGYNDPAYRDLTAWLRGFVDQLGQFATEYQRQRMLEAFRASTRYEYLFWDAAWNLQSW